MKHRRVKKIRQFFFGTLASVALLGLFVQIAQAQGPTPSPGVVPTVTPTPPAWYEGKDAPWVIAAILGALAFMAGKLFSPTIDRMGLNLRKWYESLDLNFEKNYLKTLAEKYRYIKFVGVRDRIKAGRPKLEDVYISLQMGAPTQTDGDTKPNEFALGDALRLNKPLVILGEPGAGKSTLLRYLVLVFSGVVPMTQIGLSEKRLPIYVRLKDCVDGATPISELLTKPPVLHMEKSPAGFFEQRLRRGKCIVLLDGLDEVTNDAQKQVIAQKIEQLVNTYGDNRFVVTCRTAGWDSKLLPGNFVALKIRDLNPAQVTRFIHDWYKAILTNEKLLTAGIDPAKQTQAQQDAVNEARAPADELIRRLETHEGLQRLAKNPLILSLIALVHFSRQYILPQKRAELYEECLKILLDLWDSGEHELFFVDAPPVDVKYELAQAIACHFQTQGVDEADEQPLLDLIAPILKLRECKVSPMDCLRKQIVERSGLLVERAIGKYGFAHRTLQEYLVAKQYADALKTSGELFQHVHEEAWREVILLFIGLTNPDTATQTVRDILAQPDDAAHNLLVLAGQCLAENSKIDRVVRDDCLARLQAVFYATTEPLAFIRLATTLAGIGGADVAQYFETVLRDPKVNVRLVAAQALGTLGKKIAPARIANTLLGALKDEHAGVRRAAVRSLGQLGHSAREVIKPLQALRQTDDDLSVRAAAMGALIQLGHAAELNMRQIPAGEFLMGEGAEQHPVYLDEYFMGRFPVTNAEFEKFVQDGGYRDARFWELAIKDGWWNEGTFKGRYDKEPRERQYDYGAPFNLPNHPVVGITWYEANAYALWAGMRLPTEAEWEKAASWDDVKKEKRIYPWGNTFDATRCNSAESRAGARGILARLGALFRRPGAEGATTPIGQYSPRGDSAYGITDMAGNVWEWCADWYDESYYKVSPKQNPKGPETGDGRVLRGGSFNSLEDLLRAAYRGWSDPSVGYRFYGFRVVVSHASDLGTL